MIPDDILAWLIEPSDPSVCYRTYTELLGLPPDAPEAAAAKTAIPMSADVRRILDRMEPAGYWLQRNPRTQVVVGDGVEYGGFATTHFCLSYLAHLGMDRADAKVALAAERYLGLMQPDGDWYRHLSCLTGYNVQTFLLLGYRGDPRLQRSVQWLLDSGRADGGYLCDMHKGKSCIRGSLKALTAFSELGREYWGHPSCRKLLDYFLERGGIFARKDPRMPVNKDVQTTIFPFHWRAGLVEVLYTLSRMGVGKDHRLERAWTMLAAKADPSGRYLLEWTPTQNPWKVGKRGQPNKWMTLYALLARKASE